MQWSATTTFYAPASEFATNFSVFIVQQCHCALERSIQCLLFSQRSNYSMSWTCFAETPAWTMRICLCNWTRLKSKSLRTTRIWGAPMGWIWQIWWMFFMLSSHRYADRRGLRFRITPQNWSFDCPIDWLIDRLLDWLIDPLIAWLIDWLIDWSVLFSCIYGQSFTMAKIPICSNGFLGQKWEHVMDDQSWGLL